MMHMSLKSDRCRASALPGLLNGGDGEQPTESPNATASLRSMADGPIRAYPEKA